MASRVRPPLFVVAMLLLGLVVLLALLQYRWLGQVSEAERDRMRATLSSGAAEFAQDFDREVTRAYLLFQTEPGSDEELAKRLAERHARWQATARFPRMLGAIYVFTHDPGAPRLRRFDPAAATLREAEWPASMSDWRQQFANTDVRSVDTARRAVFIARISQPVWESVPAIVSPMPFFFWEQHLTDPPAAPPLRTFASYAILTLDVDYVKKELLPTLAEHHFGRGSSALDFYVAVVRTAEAGGVIYSSTPAFSPAPAATADAATELFQVRTQDFATIAAEVRRFATLTTGPHAPAAIARGKPADAAPDARVEGDTLSFREVRPFSIVVQSAEAAPPRGGERSNIGAVARPLSTAPRWRLLLQHPAGSLEAAVARVRRRNLVISSSVLGVLAASMGLLVLSTRRAQRLARQQLEFVATVSHELRTPLAVIRSAAENLADGVVREEDQIRKYGELMRSEGRRLTEMVEQILELAGIQSGQRGFALRPVALGPLVEDVLSSSAALLTGAGVQVEVRLAPGLPAVLGDEAALRRVLLNLVANAIKYGARGGWIGISAAPSGADVRIVVADRGMGIAAAEQARIFEPFYRAGRAVEAQIQGAGLGLSLVQRIVQAHRGRVFVESRPGEGAAFTVVLPAAGDEAPVRSLDATQPASSR